MKTTKKAVPVFQTRSAVAGSALRFYVKAGNDRAAREVTRLRTGRKAESLGRVKDRKLAAMARTYMDVGGSNIVYASAVEGQEQGRDAKVEPLPSLYDQAVALQAKLAEHQTAMPLSAMVVSYSPEVTKVRVDFLRNGAPALSIEYWGNAELDWVEVNVDMNAAHVANASDKPAAPGAAVAQLQETLFQVTATLGDYAEVAKGVPNPLRKRSRTALADARKLLGQWDGVQHGVLASLLPKVEVVKRHGAKTLGGDVDGLSTLIAERLRVSTSQGRQLLSDACERIEFACDGEGLEAIKAEDIVAMARTVLMGH